MRAARLISILMMGCSVAAVGTANAPLEAVDSLFLEAVNGLPWELELVADEGADRVSMAKVPECRASRILVLRTLRPLREGPAGPVHLELALTALQFESVDHARFAFESALDGADPDTGLSYAWDLLAVSGRELYLLHAPCLLEEDRWHGLADRFAELLAASGAEVLKASCRCGGGCR